MKRANMPTNRERKQAEAKLRQEHYATLTPAEKLAALDALFGPGQGARRQRAKLAEGPRPLVLHGRDAVLAIEEPDEGQATGAASGEGRPKKQKRRGRNEKRGA